MMHVPEVNIYCGCMLQRRVDAEFSAPALVKCISDTLQMDIVVYLDRALTEMEFLNGIFTRGF
jgi:hypothetical protein